MYRVQTELALDLLAKVTASPLNAPSPFPFPPQKAAQPPSAITPPVVLFNTRTSKCGLFTRNEAMSLDTPQNRDQPQPGVKPDLTATPPTTVASTPAPRTGDQDSEWKTGL